MSTNLKHRIAVASRIGAGTAGGYILAAMAVLFLSLILPGQRSDAVIAGTMASFPLYAIAIIWAFSASSATRAWIGIALFAALLGGISLLAFEGSRV